MKTGVCEGRDEYIKTRPTHVDRTEEQGQIDASEAKIGAQSACAIHTTTTFDAPNDATDRVT
jgi:hypothetical protein